MELEARKQMNVASSNSKGLTAVAPSSQLPRVREGTAVTVPETVVLLLKVNRQEKGAQSLRSERKIAMVGKALCVKSVALRSRPERAVGNPGTTGNRKTDMDLEIMDTVATHAAFIVAVSRVVNVALVHMEIEMNTEAAVRSALTP